MQLTAVLSICQRATSTGWQTYNHLFFPPSHLTADAGTMEGDPRVDTHLCIVMKACRDVLCHRSCATTKLVHMCYGCGVLTPLQTNSITPPSVGSPPVCEDVFFLYRKPCAFLAHAHILFISCITGLGQHMFAHCTLQGLTRRPARRPTREPRR